MAATTAAVGRGQGSTTTKMTRPRNSALDQAEELLGQQLAIQQCISKYREEPMNSPGDKQNAVLQLLVDQMESIPDKDWVHKVVDQMWLYVALPGAWEVSTEESVEKMWSIFQKRKRV